MSALGDDGRASRPSGSQRTNADQRSRKALRNAPLVHRQEPDQRVEQIKRSLAAPRKVSPCRFESCSQTGTLKARGTRGRPRTPLAGAEEPRAVLAATSQLQDLGPIPLSSPVVTRLDDSYCSPEPPPGSVARAPDTKQSSQAKFSSAKEKRAEAPGRLALTPVLGRFDPRVLSRGSVSDLVRGDG